MPTHKYGQELPAEIEAKLDAYVERVRQIKWFRPDPKLDREKAEDHVKLALSAFGVTAEVEWRSLKTVDDWDAAWDAAGDAAGDAAWVAAWGAAGDAARGAARGAAKGAAWDAAKGAARVAARGAAWDAARGATEIVVSDLPAFTGKYPNGAFLLLLPLWEMGLYPVGVINGKFVIYQPEAGKS